jgi:hypothetical protein
MGYEKLAKEIYRLAQEVENGRNEAAGSVGFEAHLRREASARTAGAAKTAQKMVQFTDAAGNTFILPHELVGTSRWAYSPYDRSRSERSGVFNVQMTGKLEEAFSPTAGKAASVKTAEKMVQFRDDAGRTFVLPFDQVGQGRWAYSPFDRSRAKREGLLNITLSDKLEEAFGA